MAERRRYTEWKATTLSAYVNRVAKIKEQWIEDDPERIDPRFRGHADCNYTLLPGSYRITDSAVDEDDYRLEFQLKARPYLEGQVPSDQWEWYFLMQHYGLPTRLFGDN